MEIGVGLGKLIGLDSLFQRVLKLTLEELIKLYFAFEKHKQLAFKLKILLFI